MSDEEEQTPDNTSLLYDVAKIGVGPFLKATFRPWIEGEENIPDEGAAILASNHLSFSDSIFLPLKMKRKISFLAKSEYFTGKGIKGKLTAKTMRSLNQIPMDRSGGKAAQKSLGKGADLLKDGHLLGIYPEGTRSPDGLLYRGKIGVAKLALESQVPVIPVAMIGTAQVQPIGQKIPKIKRVGIKIGKPLDFSRYYDQANNPKIQRLVTDEIMYEIMRLSGQESADMYASTRKDQIEKEKQQKSKKSDDKNRE